MLEIAPISDEYFTYDNAVIYCQFLEHNGHRDWRMPTWPEHEEYSGQLVGWWVESDWLGITWRVTPVRYI
jgi:hypothetical protein